MLYKERGYSMKKSFRGYCAALLSLAMVVSTVQPALAKNGSENEGNESTLDVATPSEIKKTDEDEDVTEKDEVSTPSEIVADGTKTLVIDPNKDTVSIVNTESSKKDNNAFSITYNLGDQEVVVYEDELVD